MNRRPSIPVTIVSGFLGAGKTTLLNRILNSDHGLRMAVMVNDFGAINIDSQLIVSQTQTTVSLTNGCICCTVESDLIEQLSRMLDSRENRPEYIVIEASGVSNPQKIANTLRYPQFRNALNIDSIVTVVDAAQFEGLKGEMAQLAMDQLDAADIIVLNKIDQVSDEQVAALRARWLYPNVRLLQAQHCEVPLELVLGVGRLSAVPKEPLKKVASDESTRQKNAKKQSLVGLNEHFEQFFNAVISSAVVFQRLPKLKPVTATSMLGATPEPDHGSVFATWSWQCDQPLSLKALRQTLAALPANIYRAKGICNIAEAPRQRSVLHLVGSRSEIKLDDDWRDTVPYSQFIVIGTRDSINPSSLQAAFEKCIA